MGSDQGSSIAHSRHHVAKVLAINGGLHIAPHGDPAAEASWQGDAVDDWSTCVWQPAANRVRHSHVCDMQWPGFPGMLLATQPRGLHPGCSQCHPLYMTVMSLLEGTVATVTTTTLEPAEGMAGCKSMQGAGRKNQAGHMPA